MIYRAPEIHVPEVDLTLTIEIDENGREIVDLGTLAAADNILQWARFLNSRKEVSDEVLADAILQRNSISQMIRRAREAAEGPLWFLRSSEELEAKLTSHNEH